ncbi:MAG: hypothetical protein MZV70_43205 [Desulfobacterales bacterium]|nr:hypothetical protein [Desulfobacterales bacterium]
MTHAPIDRADDSGTGAVARPSARNPRSCVAPNSTESGTPTPGEAIDPARPLVRCSACKVLYHAASAQVLARDNQGRCAACGGSSFQAVTLLDG